MLEKTWIFNTTPDDFCKVLNRCWDELRKSSGAIYTILEQDDQRTTQLVLLKLQRVFGNIQENSYKLVVTGFTSQCRHEPEEASSINLYRMGIDDGIYSFEIFPLNSSQIRIIGQCRLDNDEVFVNKFHELWNLLLSFYGFVPEVIASPTVPQTNDIPENSSAILPGESPINKRIIELWKKGLSYQQIGKRQGIGLATKSVANIITQLRKKYGVELIPYHRKPKNPKSKV